MVEINVLMNQDTKKPNSVTLKLVLLILQIAEVAQAVKIQEDQVQAAMIKIKIKSNNFIKVCNVLNGLENQSRVQIA